MKQPGLCPAVLFVAKSTVSSIAASLNQQMVDSCIVSVNQSGWHKNELRSNSAQILHSVQLLDLSQELEENENDFFDEDNTRYFHLFTQRVSRLHDLTTSLREYSIQIRDLYQSQLDIKQNRTMALLTIITSIFMPLTLIAVSIAIVILSLVFFKKKKWL